jgi:hypothetical protein
MSAPSGWQSNAERALSVIVTSALDAQVRQTCGIASNITHQPKVVFSSAVSER